MPDGSGLLSPHLAPPAIPDTQLYGSVRDAALWLRAGLDALKELNSGLNTLPGSQALLEAEAPVALVPARTNRPPFRAGHPITWTALVLHTDLALEPYPRQPPMGRVPTGIIGELC